MRDTRKASESIKNIVHKFKDLILVGEELENQSSLEQYTRELNEGILQKQNSISGLDAEIEDFKKKLKSVHDRVHEENKLLSSTQAARVTVQRQHEELLESNKNEFSIFVKEICKQKDNEITELRNVKAAIGIEKNNLSTLNATIQAKRDALAAVSK